MHYMSLKINSEWSIVVGDVGSNYDCVTPISPITLMRYGEKVDTTNNKLDNLHCALIVELYKVRKACSDIHRIVDPIAAPY